MIMQRTCLLVIAISVLSCFSLSCSTVANSGEQFSEYDPAQLDPYQVKPRVFVLSDIGNEPDDQMSLTRFLLYTNELNVEGLVATTSTWQRDKVRPDIMKNVIKNYEKVLKNLRRHDPEYPDAESLYALIKSGQAEYGMSAVGDKKQTDGSNLLVNAIRRDDPMPLHIGIWGGANTLAQALIQIRNEHTPEEAHKLISKIRVYSISDQDDAGPWIRDNFPDVHYVVSPSSANGEAYSSATWTGIAGDKFYRNAPGADFSTVSNSWLDKNIRSKGPMGKTYPFYWFIMEGDTPAFLGLIRNGLASEMSPAWGGWGGRYVYRQPLSEARSIWTHGGDFFPGSPNGADTVEGKDGRDYTTNQATIWRWREAFQNDFAARMDWTIKGYSEANHNPNVVVNGDEGKEPLMISATVGDSITLNAEETSDPDGNDFGYHWFIYHEASQVHREAIGMDEIEGDLGEDFLSMPSRIELSNDRQSKVDVKLKRAGKAHVILAVEDQGQPSLTSYRRVVISIVPAP